MKSALILLGAFLIGMCAFVSMGLAQGAGTAEFSRCIAFVDRAPRIVPVRFQPAASARVVARRSYEDGGRTTPAAAAPEVRITFATHSTFRIETPAGVVIATDYAGYAGAGPMPTVVTMNHAHETHYTDYIDPGIQHVLRGWNPAGGPANHKLKVEDVFIRNVPTDIKRWNGAIEPFGNSIFIFEVADLCIGHLGHLHHKLTNEQLAQIGRLDILFVPVDGSYTLNLAEMTEVVRQLRTRLVIPMHYFAGSSLQRFIAGLRDGFQIEVLKEPATVVSVTTLPARPTVRVLPGY
jgi:L-ascorbate metabolism protein UlaG (beta-lactamase superfamily)